MQRKYVYGLLALPVVLFLVLLAVMPGETRSTFFTEFKHRARLMMGYEPEVYSEELGLRSEHPGEYGNPPAEEPETDGENSESVDDTEADEKVDSDAESATPANDSSDEEDAQPEGKQADATEPADAEPAEPVGAE